MPEACTIVLDTLLLDTLLAPAELWPQVAGSVRSWCQARSVGLRDTVVLVPFAPLIDPARRAFAALGGWQPRIETPLTWARSLGPPPPAQAGAVSGGTICDTLSAGQRLRREPHLAALEQRDPRAFHHAVALTVVAAQSLHEAAFARAPGGREAFWAEARAACAGSRDPDALERALARMAIEWASASPPPATAALFDARPGALVWIEAGGAAPLPAALADHLGVPALRLQADPAPREAFDAAAHRAAPRLVVVGSIEAEARAVAGETLEQLRQGLRPVALVALDRALMRRVRALLERRGVSIADETGWALSTTRAASSVMALLKAAASAATQDETLEALKALPASVVNPLALQQLERHWRAGKTVAGTPAGDLLSWMRRALRPLGEPGRLGLDAWLALLGRVLDEVGLGATLAADEAGAQVLTALRPGDDRALVEAMRAERLDAAGLRAWLARTLEGSTFLPPPVAVADVVVMPLGRAVLRPSGAVVVGGADDRTLLASKPHAGLFSEPAARALGLESPLARLERERLAVAHLLRVPHLSFVRRQREGTEPLAASAALESIDLARRRAGLEPMRPASPVDVPRHVSAAPLGRPAPAAAGALPDRISASTLEALRSCPYRFFSRAVLHLREIDELEESVERRDYGTWLHAVLDRFHRARGPDADDAAVLLSAAESVSAESSLATARLLPYRLGFEWLAPRYLAWLHEREAAGLRWSAGEFDAERTPPELDGVRLFGRIDRVDRGPGQVAVVDYKTGGVDKLRSQLRNPTEDTQLAFYALLMEADRAGGEDFEALYLALDDPGGPRELPHPQVAQTARTMLHALADELRRLRAGERMPALGEGRVCDYCEARGLCRRDHWEPGE